MSAPPNRAATRDIAAALDALPIAICATAPDGTIEYANPHFHRLLGRMPGQPIGTDIAQFRTAAASRLRVEMRSTLLGGEAWQCETALAAASGVCTVLESAYPVRDEAGRLLRVVHFFHELAVLRRTGALDRLAFYDALTGLANRTLLEERLIAGVAAARRTGKSLAILHSDVEHFDCVNMVLDRDAGDHLLRLIALRIQQTVRASDSVARLGGDAFAVLLPEVAGADAAFRTGEKLRRACSGWYDAGGREHSVTLSVGVAVLSQSDTARDLLIRAETAMYRDKAARRDSYHVQARFVGTRYPLDRA